MNGRQCILIVTNGPLCRNPRPLKEAETLGRAGYDVTVLAVRNHAASEAADAELTRAAPFGRVDVDMIKGGKSAPSRIFLRRLRQRIARQLTIALGWQTPEALGPAGLMLRCARALPADLTIVHNEVPHWVGARLLREGRRVAVDFEDWHSEDLLPEDRRARPLALIRNTERTLLRGAAYATTTSHALADALQGRYGGVRPEVIANAFPLQPDPRQGPPGDPPAFIWFSQTLGCGRGLEPFLAAWGRCSRPSKVTLVGDAPHSFQESLRLSVPEARRAFLAFHPLVPPPSLPALISRSDIGLALEDRAIVSRNLTITNKILQYLNAGLAIVASDTAGQREVLSKSPDSGIVIDAADTGHLTAQLDTLVANRQALEHRQSAARRLAEQVYCWEKEGPRFLEIVERALKTP